MSHFVHPSIYCLHVHLPDGTDMIEDRLQWFPALDKAEQFWKQGKMRAYVLEMSKPGQRPCILNCTKCYLKEGEA